MKKIFLVATVLVVLAFGGILIVGWILAHPVQMSIGKPPIDLDARPVSFDSASGTKVAAWWCPVAKSHAVVILLPGIRANRLSMVNRARFLGRATYSTLLIDFQGTGETKGDRITFGWKESRDVLAAVEFIRQTQPSNQIAILGSSLGGAAALLATPPLKVDALVLEAVYPTIEIATNNRLENYLGPLGRSAAQLLLIQLRLRLGVSTSDLRPVDHIGKVNCPILIMSGEKDRQTRPEDTRMLAAHARFSSQPWLVPNAGHIDLHSAATKEYESRVLTFLSEMRQNP